MKAKDEFSKKLREALDQCQGAALFTGQTQFSVSTLLPFVLRSLAGEQVILVLCGENYGRTAALMKRVHLSEAAFQSYTVIDVFQRLCAWVGEEYPITTTAGKHAATRASGLPAMEAGLLPALTRLLSLSGEEAVIILPDLEYLAAAALEAGLKSELVAFVDQLGGLKCKRLLLGFNDDFFRLPTFSFLKPWLLSYSDCRIKIAGLKTGNSQDITAVIKLKFTNAKQMLRSKRSLKFRAAFDTVDFLLA